MPESEVRRERLVCDTWPPGARFGFLRPPEWSSARGVLLHRDQVPRRVRPGEEVECELIATVRGLKAVKVRLLSEVMG